MSPTSPIAYDHGPLRGITGRVSAPRQRTVEFSGKRRETGADKSYQDIDNMRLFAGTSLAALASLALSACGGASEPAAAPAATAEAEVAAPETTAAPAAAPAPAEPSLEFAHLPEPYKSANYAAGVRTWKLCQSCHLTAEGAGNLVGPNLHGIFGRQVASAPGFDYSPALKAETFTWTPEQLDHWLQNPSTFVRGNRMSFAGVRRESDRVAVIAWLMAETGYEAPPAE